MQTDRGELYLGGLIEPGTNKRSDPLIYDADELVTHGVIVGMTGSGKTGLGIDLLEEALLSDVPCLILDPKGDMGNLALIFPELAPADFAPWVDPTLAGKEGVDVAELAEKTAAAWREGLASWQIGPDRMRAVNDGSTIRIYTPGSGAGIPISVLGSLSAPPLSWEDHEEDLRDEIEGFVSSLLVLASIEADPVSSPSHILLSTLIEEEWKAGRDLDLARLVAMIPDPPVRKLGVFPLDEFYPEKDRTQLAMQLNGLLASPSFAAWLEGEPLDIERLLQAGDGTNAAVIYLAHLSDAERQFVVTLLLSKLVTWMRRQAGTGKLRALVYMDEVFGFCPPVAEPPAKKQILTILKQARAHGVGMVLATQNPVDLDYKAMSNAGLWMIGRLQTENDKKRILEGLIDAGATVDAESVDTLISNLDKREFVLRHTGSIEPRLFATRWAMSYLAGPLDRQRVSALTRDDDRASPSPRPPEEVTPGADASSPTAPPAVEGVDTYTLDPAAAWSSQVGAAAAGRSHQAIAAATVHLLYDDRYAGVDHREDYEAVIHPLTADLRPEAVIAVDHDARDFRTGPPQSSDFFSADAPIGDASFWKRLGSQLRDLLVRERSVTVWKNPALKLYSRVGESEEEFRRRCRQAAEDAADEDLAKLTRRYNTRIDRVKASISQADRRVAELSTDVAARQQQEVIAGAGDLLGSLLGGRSRSGAIRRAASRRSRTQRTAADLETATGRLQDEERELVDLEAELQSEVEEIVAAWEGKADDIETVPIPLEASDVEVKDLRLVWVPVDSESRPHVRSDQPRGSRTRGDGGGTEPASRAGGSAPG